MAAYYLSEANGNDANDGLSKVNAVQTWDQFFVLITALGTLTEPIWLYIGNETKSTLSSLITDVPYTNFNAKYPLIIDVYLESDSGLFHSFPNGVAIPCWEVDCNGLTEMFDGAANRPNYAFFNNGRIRNTTGTLDFGSYNKHIYMDWVDVGGTATFGVDLANAYVYGCRLTNPITPRGRYGLQCASSHIANCIVENCTGAGIYVTTQSIIRNNIVRDCSHTYNTQGMIYLASVSSGSIIENNVLDGGDDDIEGVVVNSYIGGVIRNNIITNVTKGVVVDTADVAALKLGPNAFYNVTTTFEKDDPSVGIESGIMFDRTSGDVILSEDPFVDSVGGDYNLTPNSECRGRGQVEPVGHLGMVAEQRPLRCDMGAIQYGIPSLPRAVSGKIY